MTRVSHGLLPLAAERLHKAKRAYTTRRCTLERATHLLTAGIPQAGDLVLARVTRLGQHGGLQLPDGRRATLFAGDEIVVAYGNRYAPDQFEAFVPADLGPCQLVAGGGIAATTRSAHARMKRATEIEPVGLLADDGGRPLNLRDAALPEAATALRVGCPVIAVIGTAMNAGKTTAAAHLIRGLSNAGLRVGAAKVTGTGASGDTLLFSDAGAHRVLDFTDFGLASTFRAGTAEVERVLRQSVAHLERDGAQAIVLEVADGLFQAETAALVAGPVFRRIVSGVVFAAGDAMGAASGVEWLEQRAVPVLAIGGLLTASPLAAGEAAAATNLPVLGLAELSDADESLSLLALLERRQQAAGVA